MDFFYALAVNRGSLAVPAQEQALFVEAAHHVALDLHGDGWIVISNGSSVVVISAC